MKKVNAFPYGVEVEGISWQASVKKDLKESLSNKTINYSQLIIFFPRALSVLFNLIVINTYV